MLGDVSGLEKIYIVCGYTDMRKSIDGLCTVIEDHSTKSVASSSAFLRRIFMQKCLYLYVYSTPPLTIRPQLILLSKHFCTQICSEKLLDGGV